MKLIFIPFDSFFINELRENHHFGFIEKEPFLPYQNPQLSHFRHEALGVDSEVLKEQTQRTNLAIIETKERVQRVMVASNSRLHNQQLQKVPLEDSVTAVS